MISASVAPFLRWSRATTWAAFVPLRGPAPSCALPAFLAGAVFLGAAALGLPPLALFRPLGVRFDRLGLFLGAAFSGTTAVAGAATVAVVALSMFMLVSFCRDQRGHRHQSLQCTVKASGNSLRLVPYRCTGAGAGAFAGLRPGSSIGRVCATAGTSFSDQRGAGSKVWNHCGCAPP